MTTDDTDLSHFFDDGQTFLRQLKKNNTKPWFEKNRNDYKTRIQGPSKVFADRLTHYLSELSGHRLHPKIFRINRDMRFSKGKTPYKPYVHMTFASSLSAGKPNGAAFFFGLETDRIVLGTGCFMLEKSALDAYRRAVADDVTGTELSKALRKLEKKGANWAEPELKRVPAGFDSSHPREALLRRKSLAAWQAFTDINQFKGPDPAKKCLREFKPMYSLYQWLFENTR